MNRTRTLNSRTAGLCFVLGLAVALGSVTPAMAQADGSAAAEGQKPLTLGVVLYPGFELLDVFGPVEMFANVGSARLKIVMVAEKAGPVHSGSTADPGTPKGPAAVAEYGFADAPHMDILLVPGGIGTLTELNNPAMLDFLKERSAKASITSSVCSGSAILAKAGLLDGKKATSNKQFFSMVRAQGPKVQWVEEARWVEDGTWVTSSGVSAGMDLALALIARLFSEEEAQAIADGTEYQWHKNAAEDPFFKFLK